ncbi:rhodanese-like domain-containing protein [Lignipirellula cremea]|uniref:Putative adenylyltransferase/sulfurtransferase MoeZ n=1 Tax=Lignipirellula cremea TaxID=2528010 RepID=A0A518DR07_9BACT|nr:rhodanese-like domain-containing protein [Lignipirellula cremea]QDU94276.1 putative adenylyltransferase/sulfurtransferase MoeZ [Lignipirellula cremea]
MTDQKEFPLEINVHQVKQLRDGGEEFLLLDCREPSEYEAVKIEGSKHLPMGETPSRLEELEAFRNGRIVVHCHHGGRSMKVTSFLRDQGFAGAQNMEGGIDQWSLEIDPSLPRY